MFLGFRGFLWFKLVLGIYEGSVSRGMPRGSMHTCV